MGPPEIWLQLKADSNEGAQCNIYYNNGLWSFFISHCTRMNSVPPKIYVYPEPQNVTLFGNKVFADVIS